MRIYQRRPKDQAAVIMVGNGGQVIPPTCETIQVNVPSFPCMHRTVLVLSNAPTHKYANEDLLRIVQGLSARSLLLRDAAEGFTVCSARRISLFNVHQG